MCDVKWHLFKFFNDLFTCKTCVVKIWLFDFCEVLARVSGKRQCAKCGQALKIVLKNVRWQKNKKHRVGLCVGYLFLSIFLFSVLSQWFTFQFIGVSVFFLHLAVTDWRYVFVADFEALSCQVTRKFIRCRNAETRTVSAIKYTAC
jgi:hypothetical protein